MGVQLLVRRAPTTTAVEADLDAPVAELKARVAAATGVPPPLQV